MSNTQKQIMIWGGLLLTLYMLNALMSVLIPFLIAIVFAYLADPVVAFIEKRKVSRTTSVIIVFTIFSCIMTILLLLLVPLITEQIISLINQLPIYTKWVQETLIPQLQDKLQVADIISKEDIAKALNNSIATLSKIISNILSSVSSSSLALASFAANIALLPVLTFYLMRDWDSLIAKINMLVPRRFTKKTNQLIKECDEMLGSFLKGQLLVMISLGITYGLGLSIFGIEYGLLIGLISGLVSFIPYLGFAVGIILASIATWFQYSDWSYLFITWAVFGFGQMLESFILTPKLVGDKLGMHPIAVIFALMAGGNLFGFSGILLALPCCAVLMVLLHHAKDNYLASNFYRRAK